MFDLINGLPVHPLVVHGVVVLLPLAIIGTIAIAGRSAWRVKYGPLVVVVTAVATALIPIATESGEALEEHVGSPGVHEELGEQLLWFALSMLALNLILVFLAIRAAKSTESTNADETSNGGLTGRGVITAIAALAVVASVATGIQVYRVGDSGARAAWGDQVSAE